MIASSQKGTGTIPPPDRNVFPDSPARNRDNPTARMLFFVFFIFCVALASRYFHLDQQSCAAWLRQYPLALSGLVFIALYIGLTFLVWFGPKDVLRIVAAFLYGPAVSTFLVWFGELGNAVVMFSLSRHFGRAFVARRLRGRMEKVDAAIAEKSFWGIFFLRFFLVIPFRFLDLGFGLTRIPLKKYLLIAAVGSPLRIYVIQFLLSLGTETVLNPMKLYDYLIEHPGIYLGMMLYTAGSLVLAWFLQRKFRKRRAAGPAPGQG